MRSTKLVGALVVLTAGMLGGAQQASADQYVVRNTNDSGPDSLRAAIQATNAHAGADVIRFEIPNVGQSPHVIAPLTDLDSIDERVAIDGYSQPGARARANSPAELRIVIDASAVNRGLELATDGSVVRGLVVQNALDDGIRVQGDGNRITGNYVGTDADGVLAAGNTGDGIELTGHGNIVGGSTRQDLNLVSDNDSGVAIVGSQNLVLGNAIGTDVTMTQDLGNYEGVEINDGGNRVGGSTPGEGNVISGNQYGVRVHSGTGTEIYGNLIGTDWTGSVAVGAAQDGVLVEEESAGNRVGGPATGEDNLISGGDVGVELRGDQNIVQGNLIGTTISGDAALENTEHGVEVSGDDNTIGGPGDGDGNVVSGNGMDGIRISQLGNLGPDPDGNRVEGNLIGTNDEGTAPLPNGWSGVEIVDAGPNTVGGLEAGMGNVIAASGTHGVRIWRFDEEDRANSNKVLGNAIGTDARGRLDLGNAESGVRLEGANDTHVGDASEAGANTIAFNGDDGVTVVTRQDDNSIGRNSIFSNGDLGIDLGGDGPTAHDGPLDNDTGPNGLQNYPQFVYLNVLGLLSFTLDSYPSQSFWVDFYGNRTCNDPEGRTFVARVSVTTDATGHAAGTIDIGHANHLTATATLNAPALELPPLPLRSEEDPVLIPRVNSTSEFAPCLVVPPPIVDH